MSDRKPIRFHVRDEWYFTRMPNGDVVLSAGSGSTVGITLTNDDWRSVVREMDGGKDGWEVVRSLVAAWELAWAAWELAWDCSASPGRHDAMHDVAAAAKLLDSVDALSADSNTAGPAESSKPKGT